MSTPPHSTACPKPDSILWKVLLRNLPGPQSRDLREAIEEEETAEDYGYSSDSDLEDDEEHMVSSFNQPGKKQPDPFAIPGEEKTVFEDREERVDSKAIKIRDMAFVT